jgi:hypothetical protein
MLKLNLTRARTTGMRTVSLIYQRRELRLTTISKTVLAF